LESYHCDNLLGCLFLFFSSFLFSTSIFFSFLLFSFSFSFLLLFLHSFVWSLLIPCIYLGHIILPLTFNQRTFSIARIRGS
jgi:hypothetical protein